MPESVATNTGKTLLHVAWISVVLGLAVEGAILVTVASFGKALEAKPVLADIVQKVSWSFIVCIGLALGRGASRLRGGGEPALMGLAGVLAAPLAFAIAKSLHEGIQEALFIKVFQGSGGSPFAVALIKGLEYGVLGALLAWLGSKPWGRAGAHAGTGLIVGIVFGSMLLFLMLLDRSNPPTAGALISRGLNEIIFPVGCSLTLYAAEMLGRKSV